MTTDLDRAMGVFSLVPEDERQRQLRWAQLKIELENAQVELLAHAVTLIEYLERHQSMFSTSCRNLLTSASVAKLKFEDASDRLVNRALGPHKSGAV